MSREESSTSIAELPRHEIAELRESQAQTDRRMKENAERFRETDERFKETGERLNALIIAVEESISRRRNGGRKSKGEPEPGEGEGL